MKIWIVLLSLWMGIASAAESQRNLVIAPASGEKRVALVIGNAAYPGAGALRNPANDARDFAAKLKRLGFDVTVRTDMHYRDMLRALTDFGDKVQTGSEALFFYAGHGMQVRGRNYLIPVDAEIRSENSVSSEAVDVDQLLDKLAAARLSIVILDACRNNPFERRFRGGGQGLAQINAPTGSLIAYATAPGKVAADGDGRNGLYTGELLAAMDIPGIKIEDIFKRVRGNVVRKSGDAQTPWESSSLTGDFYFRPSDGGVASKPPQGTLPIDTGAMELAFWESIKHSTDAEDFLVYLDKYPNGQFVALADRRVKKKPAKINDEPVARTEAQPMPGTIFKDCADCPEMVVIPAGTFEMGSNKGDSEEQPVHAVRIDKPFALARTEVTQGQWRAVMGNNPSTYSDCGDYCHVETISWRDAQEYVHRLTQKTGKEYRLPSEAEWEYSCRAGSSQTNCGGDGVTGKPGNAWGLHGMGGAVWEWTADCWNDTYTGAPSNGNAWTSGNCERRVVRDSTRGFRPSIPRAALRDSVEVAFRGWSLGFRPAMTLPASPR